MNQVQRDNRWREVCRTFGDSGMIRKAINGLSIITAEQTAADRLCGSLLVFCNRDSGGAVCWQRQLLDQMRVSTENRPGIVDQEVYDMSSCQNQV